jgi:hypothetical protein
LAPAQSVSFANAIATSSGMGSIVAFWSIRQADDNGGPAIECGSARRPLKSWRRAKAPFQIAGNSVERVLTTSAQP